MTVEKYNDSLEIDVTASEEKSEEDIFVDHSLKIKSFLDGKAKETKGLSGEKLIKVFRNAGSLNQDISYCVAKINNLKRQKLRWDGGKGLCHGPHATGQHRNGARDCENVFGR